MNRVRRTSFLLIIFLMIGFLGVASDGKNAVTEESFLGVWMGDNQQERFEIYKKGDKFYGKIVWTAYDDIDGNGLLDVKNPDPAKRDNSILGLEILLDFEFKGKNILSGRVYDPGSGNTYKCRIKVYGDRAEVRGYVLVPLLGRTEVAHRYSE